jgi:hypothetical protein
MSDKDILDWLTEAEAEWIVARESSGYGLSSAWAMRYGRKLVFDYRRAVGEVTALQAQIAEMKAEINSLRSRAD